MGKVILTSYDDCQKQLDKLVSYAMKNGVHADGWMYKTRIENIKSSIINHQPLIYIHTLLTALANEFIYDIFTNLMSNDDKYRKLALEVIDLRTRNIKFMKKNAKNIKADIIAFLNKNKILNANKLKININYYANHHYYSRYDIKFSDDKYNILFSVQQNQVWISTPSYFIKETYSNGIIDIMGKYFANNKFKKALNEKLVNIYEKYYGITSTYSYCSLRDTFKKSIISNYSDIFNFDIKAE